jgi:hypothetical protein
MVADTHTAAHQPGGDPTHVVVELRIRPLAAVPVPGGPNKCRVIATLGRPIRQEPSDVLPVHVELLELRRVQRGTPAFPGYFGVTLHALSLRGHSALLCS